MTRHLREDHEDADVAITDVVRCSFCDGRMGKSVAFDPERQRLWAVCGRCGAWNLAPMDEDVRRRAIAQLDVAFRFVRGRRGGRGRGRIAVGRYGALTLVRVGRGTNWREIAAWRYGKRLRARRFWWRVSLGGYIAALIFLYGTAAGDALLTLPIVVLALAGYQVWEGWRVSHRVIWKCRTGELTVRGALDVTLERDGRVLVPHNGGASVFEGEEATRVLAAILPALNMAGASAKQVRRAIGLVESGSFQSLKHAAMRHGASDVRLSRWPYEERLALEMAVNEYAESRLLAGDLALIERDSSLAGERARIVDEL